MIQCVESVKLADASELRYKIMPLIDARPDGTALVLNGPASCFTFDMLEDISECALKSWRPIGVVPNGRSKVPERALGQGADFTYLRIGSPDLACAHPMEGHLGALRAPRHLVSVFGHGDGMHLNMDGVALCGAPQGGERYNSIAVPRGCDAAIGSCKKSTVVDSVFPAIELDCDVLALFSCNSMLLAGQLYPSNNSIALAAWASGAARYVIGTTRQMAFSDTEIDAAANLISQGVPLGEVVLALNAYRRASGDAGFYVLLGEPDATVGPRWDSLEGRKGDLPVIAPKAKRENSNRLTRLSTLHTRLGDGSRVALALRILYRGIKEQAVVDALREVEQSRRLITDRAWLAAAHQSLKGTVPQRTSNVLVRSIIAWQDQCLRSVESADLLAAGPGGDVGDRLTRALAMFAAPASPRPAGDPCLSCGGTIWVRPLEFDFGTTRSGPTRYALECAACGPRGNVLQIERQQDILEYPPMLQLKGRVARPGQMAVLKLRYSTEDAFAAVPIVLQVRDKSKREPLPLTYSTLTPGQAVHPVEFKLPSDSGSEIFSARVVVFNSGSLDILRCVFPVMAIQDYQ